MDTHGLVCEFGRHRGQLYTRIPVSYLRWMVNKSHPQAEIAAAELERRGTILPEVDVSGHAIDRASTRCWFVWNTRRKDGEGLHSWLARVSLKALKKGRKIGPGKYVYMEMKFVFDLDGCWPVLLTVSSERR